jgi:hypothetical protein
MPDASDDCPRGLVLHGLQDDNRRAPRLAFLGVTIGSGLALIWPIYPLAGHIRPYVLGLPFSFAWVVGWLVVMFVTLALLFRTEEVDADTAD